MRQMAKKRQFLRSMIDPIVREHNLHISRKDGGRINRTVNGRQWQAGNSLKKKQLYFLRMT